ncbi:MAG: hypothetical protein EBS36_05205 [Actinobacteria bacterium]|nr:hypothetical protein [Actinomycetota bacterium]
MNWATDKIDLVKKALLTKWKRIRRSLRETAETIYLYLPYQKVPENRNLVAVWTAPRITNNVGDRALTEGSINLIPDSNCLLIARDGQEYADSLAKVFTFPQTSEAGRFIDFVKIIAKWLANQKVKVQLFSMSWNTSPTSAAKQAALSASKNGVTTFSRDELSVRRLRDLGVKAEFAADVSFLRSNYVEPNDEVQAWFNRPTKKVLVNVSDWVTDDPTMFTGLISALSSLGDDYEILYVPMVHYGANTDTVACTKLANEVTGWVLPKLPTPSELRWMAERSEFSISARMHCCLIGFAAGLPSVGLEYQGKFEGAFKVFGLERFAIKPEEFSAKFLPAFDEIVATNAELRANILQQLPDVTASARVPVDLALASIKGITD